MSDRALVTCICLGAEDAPNRKPCDFPATQEDFLCDHCRAVQCETRLSAEFDDFTLCHRLGCPEHSIPDGRVGVAF